MRRLGVMVSTLLVSFVLGALERSPVWADVTVLGSVRGTACYTAGKDETPAQAKNAAMALARQAAVENYAPFVQAATALKDFQQEDDLLQAASVALLRDVQIEQTVTKLDAMCITIIARIDALQFWKLIPQEEAREVAAQASPPKAVPAAPPTGLIVLADHLPTVVVAMAPRLLDENGATLYGPGHVSPLKQVAIEQGVVDYVNSLHPNWDKICDRVGPTPMIVTATAVAENQKDLYLSAADAARLRMADDRQQFLKDAMVVIVLKVMKTGGPPPADSQRRVTAETIQTLCTRPISPATYFHGAPNISAEGMGVGDSSLQGTAAYRQAGELAALTVALRNLEERFLKMADEMQDLAHKKDRTEAERRRYQFLKEVGVGPWRGEVITVTTVGADFKEESGVSMGRVPLQLRWATFVENYQVTQDVIELKAGGQTVLVEEFVTKDSEQAHAVFELVKRNGFDWSFSYAQDGAVTCTLVYPVTELKNLLATRSVK